MTRAADLKLLRLIFANFELKSDKHVVPRVLSKSVLDILLNIFPRFMQLRRNYSDAQRKCLITKVRVNPYPKTRPSPSPELAKLGKAFNKYTTRSSLADLFIDGTRSGRANNSSFTASFRRSLMSRTWEIGPEQELHLLPVREMPDPHHVHYAFPELFRLLGTQQTARKG